MRFRPSMLFTIAVITVAAYAVYSARDWPLGTGLFPRYVGLPVLILSLAQFMVDAYQSMKPGARQADTGDLQVDLNMESRLVARRALGFMGWLLLLFFGILLFGFFITIPLFTFLYLKLQAKEGWVMSLSLTVGIIVFFIGVFDQLLHVRWPDPIIAEPDEALKTLFPWLG